MYVKAGAASVAFDAVACLEGRFAFRPDLDTVPTAEVIMVLLNSSTKTTYGSCPVRVFSPRTLEALMEFLKCAEQDFGDVVFGEGVMTPFGPLSTPGVAETNRGLPRGLGEER